MSKPLTVCVECERQMKVLKNGARVVFWSSRDDHITEVWCGDMWYCPECLTKTIPHSSFGNEPLYIDCIKDITQENLLNHLENWKENNGIEAYTTEGPKYFPGSTFVVNLY